METIAATASTLTAAASARTAEQKSRLDASTDYETFLTLLTAQIRNQDPLEPVDSTQFVAQLASFSTVEQQIQSNAKLDAILAALNGGGAAAADLAGWIGKEVRAAAAAAFDGSPVEVFTRPVEGADTARLVVRDSDNAIVASAAVDPQAEVVSWSGASELGVAEPGFYSFSVESFREGQFLEARDGEVFVPVTEVRVENDAMVLVFADGEKVNADAIEAVRAAAASGTT